MSCLCLRSSYIKQVARRMRENTRRNSLYAPARRPLMIASKAPRVLRKKLKIRSFHRSGGKWNNRSGAGGGVDSQVSTFVSKYFSMDEGEILNYMDRKGFEYKHTPTGSIRLSTCPLCARMAESGGFSFEDTGTSSDQGPGSTFNNNSNQMSKFYIFLTNGNYKCYSCNRGGTWYDLKRELGDVSDILSLNSRYSHSSYRSSSSNSGLGGGGERAYGGGGGHFSFPDSRTKDDFQENLDKSPAVLKYLTGKNYKKGQRGITREILRKYGIGVCNFQETLGNTQEMREGQYIAFPWTEKVPYEEREDADDKTHLEDDPESYRVVRWKLVSLPPIDDEGKFLEVSNQPRYLPDKGVFGFFGEHTVKDDANSIVICESEFDALLISQYTAVCLPHGHRQLPPVLLQRLERFSKIYLWLHQTARSQAQASHFANKLGISRVYNVRLSSPKEAASAILSQKNSRDFIDPPMGHPRDASELVFALSPGTVGFYKRASKEISVAVEAAAAFPHEQILDFSELRAMVYDEFVNSEGYKGLKSTSFPTLTRILKGFRRGEVTIVTGTTGVGKTSYLSQLSLDYAKQGVPTLWGSFEIKNSQLAKRMLTQYSQKDFSQSIEGFNEQADAFEKLPMYFMRFFGMSDVDKVLDAMDYAVYVYDVQHIILDNLQFMVGFQQSAGFSKFDNQDRALDLFRKFSTERDVHITIVIHPRKELDRVPLGISSVFGSAKATQESDNIIILQKPETLENKTKFRPSAEIDYRVMEIKKNRYDGELGAVPYRFDRDTLTMKELSDLERVRIGLTPVDQEFPNEGEASLPAWSLQPGFDQAIPEEMARGVDIKVPQEAYEDISVHKDPTSFDSLKWDEAAADVQSSVDPPADDIIEEISTNIKSSDSLQEESATDIQSPVAPLEREEMDESVDELWTVPAGMLEDDKFSDDELDEDDSDGEGNRGY
mmetsp:Transcript_13364/g.19998  ORF Transcript_13364/g.19998 Transcript_13364/m.19998 type:complete len:945 (-) Transcript_13364:175-3009(-)